LERQLVQKEITAIFGAVPASRLQWRFGAGLGADRTLDDLLGEGFSAVCLALGLGESASLGNGRPEGVIEANDFLSQMNRHADHRVSGDVAVIGGGNTAIDAAVMARHRGAGDVYILYRRGFAEMPAWPAQRLEALEEGIHLLLLTRADGYVQDAAGRVCGVRTVRTRLGEPDASGRRRAVEIPDSRAVLPAGMVIEALGDGPNQAAAVLGDVRIQNGCITVNADTFETCRKGVFAAGDAVNGGQTVVAALAEGRKAGKAMCGYLAGCCFA
jgi:NADPH-dependent glutamate synthase beta subunit-like oxidoreductase